MVLGEAGHLASQCIHFMNDPINCQEYFHGAPVKLAAQPAGGRGVSGAKRPAPYVITKRNLGDGAGLGNIYAGLCMEEDKMRCCELCGIYPAEF